MEMQIHLQNQTITKLKKASQTMGIKEEQLVQKAVLHYLNVIQKHLDLYDLYNEMQVWDMLSDEALVEFEEML